MNLRAEDFFWADVVVKYMQCDSYNVGSLEANAHMDIFLAFCGMMPSSSTAVLGNMVGKLNEVLLWRWSLECWWVSESNMRGGGDDFLVSLRIM